MKKSTLFFILTALVLFAVGSYFVIQNRQKNINSVTPNNPEDGKTVVPENWPTYQSQSLGFSIRYPSDVSALRQPGPNEVVFLKYGPTQQQNTEFYDGISLAFDGGSLNGQDLNQFVLSEQKKIKNDPITDLVGEIKPISINGINGYTFSISSIGSRTQTYLPQGEDNFLLIIDGTVDPSGQGFRDTVNTMLSTFEM